MDERWIKMKMYKINVVEFMQTINLRELLNCPGLRNGHDNASFDFNGIFFRKIMNNEMFNAKRIIFCRIGKIIEIGLSIRKFQRIQFYFELIQ